MFEHCKHYTCVYDEGGDCWVLNGPCQKELDSEKRCIHSGLCLKCGYAFYDGDILRCGYDTGETQKYVPGLPRQKYEKKLAVDDLPRCLIDIKHNKNKKNRKKDRFLELEIRYMNFDEKKDI